MAIACRHHLLAAAVAPVLALVAAPPASAKQASKTSAEAARQFVEASRRFEAGDFSGAIAGFQRAYRLRPHFRVQCSIARAHENLGNARQAIAHYQRCLAEGATGSPMAGRIRASLDALKGQLDSEPPMRPNSAPTALPAATSRPVHTSDGEDPAPSESARGRRGLDSKWFWIAAGTTAALVVTASVLGAQTAGLKSDYDSDPTRDGYQRFIDRRLATNIFAVSAALAGGTGLVLFYLTDFSTKDRTPRQATVVGINLRGTF